MAEQRRILTLFLGRLAVAFGLPCCNAFVNVSTKHSFVSHNSVPLRKSTIVPTVTLSSTTFPSGSKNLSGSTQANNDSSEVIESPPLENDANRRDFLRKSITTGFTIAGAVSTTAFPSSLVPIATAADEEVSTTSTSSQSPVIIIGANGRTGTECVKYLASSGMPVVATSRSGTYNALEEVSSTLPPSSTLLREAACDVTKPETLTSTIQGSKAVIFAASASKAGGTAAAVDNTGLVNVAKACIECNVPRLVIVSSGGVSKPDSPVYLFLNIFGNIMEEKIRGEDAVREMYKSLPSGKNGLSYTVVRPGGLTTDPPRGVAAVELNQGDTKSGRISRADVAAICVECLSSDAAAGTTFECYDADTAAPLASVGMSNIMKAKTREAFVSGKERRGETWGALFSGLEKDV